jgi:tetratricopeptide (TPR) repeat protein
MRSLKLAAKKTAKVAPRKVRRTPRLSASGIAPSRRRVNGGNSRQGKRPQGLGRNPSQSKVTNGGDGQLMAAVKQFETAVRYFQKESYGKAKEILKRLADTAPPEVADRARVHMRLCERRSATASAPKTAADNYLFGVAELNAGRPASAAGYLEKAHHQEPEREDVCYALAASYALQGKAEAALELLKVAVDLQPRSRFQARYDPDFRSLAGNPRFRELVGLAACPAAP